MNDSINQLQEASHQLSIDERHRLGDLVIEWEEKYGKDPRLSPSVQSAAQPASASGASLSTSPVQRLRSQISQSPESETMGEHFSDPAKSTGQSAKNGAASPIVCPHCGSSNLPNSAICRSCGQMLQAKPPPPTRQLEDTITRKAKLLADFFGPDSTLVLTIATRGGKVALDAFPRDKMIIGRGFSPIRGQPFLDLSPYEGELLGVSRYHAEIRFLNNTLVITDLNSDNGTFINEVRVYPYEIRVLHNNDELRVGRLSMKMAFKLAVRG